MSNETTPPSSPVQPLAPIKTPFLLYAGDDEKVHARVVDPWRDPLASRVCRIQPDTEDRVRFWSSSKRPPRRRLCK